MSVSLYIAGCRKDGGIYHCLLSEDGKLRIASVTPMDRPMFLAAQNDTLYALLRNPYPDSPNSALCSFPILADGSLGEMSPLQSADGECACHLTLWNGTPACANYLSGSAKLFPDVTISHTGSGPNLPRQDAPHTHCVLPTPDGAYLAVTDLGLDTVGLYRRDGSLHMEAHVPAGHGARHLVFSPDGSLLYCVNELASTITVMTYQDGSLAVRGTYPVLPAGYHGRKNTAAAIRYHDGYLYVSNRGHNSISVLRAVGDRLTLEQIADCGGDFPRDFDLFGNYFVVTNQFGNSVSVLEKNGHRIGRVTDVLYLPEPLCVIASPKV